MRRELVFFVLICWMIVPAFAAADPNEIRLEPRPDSYFLLGEVTSYTSQLSGGWAYIWYDADGDGRPQTDEVETVLFEAEGFFQSSLRYYPGMPLVIEVHAMAHYVERFHVYVPEVDQSQGEPVMLGMFRVMPMVSTISDYRIYTATGENLVREYPLIYSGQLMTIDIWAFIDANKALQLGQEPYRSIADGVEYAGTTCVVRTPNYASIPDETYDWAYSDPSYLYFAYAIGAGPIEPERPIRLIMLQFEWIDPADIEIAMYFIDGSWPSPAEMAPEIFLSDPVVTFRSENTMDGYVLQCVAYPEWHTRETEVVWLAGSDPTDVGRDSDYWPDAPWGDEGYVVDPIRFLDPRTPQGFICVLVISALIAYRARLFRVGPRKKRRPKVLEDNIEIRDTEPAMGGMHQRMPIMEDDVEPIEDEPDMPTVCTKPKMTIDPTGARVWVLRCAACGASMDIESVETGFLGAYCRCGHCGATNIVEVND